MQNPLKIITTLTASILALQSAPLYANDTNPSVDKIHQRLLLLEAEIRELKEQLRQHEQAAVQQQAAKTPAETPAAPHTAIAHSNPQVDWGDKGLKISSSDQDLILSLNGYFQIDGREFFDNAAP